MNAITRPSDRPHVVRKGPAYSDTPRGLPKPLPPGETLLWQGAPTWQGFARRVLHLRKVAFYFAALSLVCLAQAIRFDTAQLWCSLLALLILGSLAVGLLALFAWLVARTTVYTMTDKRVVLRIGVALGMIINLPFAQVETAAVRLHGDGTGDIPLLMNGQTRIGWTTLWPHVRPWRTRPVQPMLRSVPDAARVSRLLAQTLAASAGQAVAVRPAAGQSVPLPDGVAVAS